MAISDEQLDWWKHLAEPIPQRIEEVKKQRDELKMHQDVRRFIALHAFAAVQTALGPLDEIRRKMIWEIKTVAAYGQFPDWYDPKDPEWK